MSSRVILSPEQCVGLIQWSSTTLRILAAFDFQFRNTGRSYVDSEINNTSLLEMKWEIT